jgi:hypothetical protein
MRRLVTFLFFAVSTLQVITDPYRGLQYDKINVYHYTQEYLEDCIHVTESEGADYNYNDYEVEEVEEEPTTDTLYFLSPTTSPWWK